MFLDYRVKQQAQSKRIMTEGQKKQQIRSTKMPNIEIINLEYKLEGGKN